jgi:hypothetical protein
MKHLCGVPTPSCKGTTRQLNSGFAKVHNSPQEAFKCYAHWLVSKGYKKLGEREYLSPEKEGGGVHVLTKKCRFGCALRQGKRGEAGGAKSSRLTFNKKQAGGGILST